MNRVWLISILFGVALLFAALGVGLGLLAPRLWNGNTRRILSTTTVIQQVRTLSQLVTVSFVMEKVVVLEDVKWVEWLGTSRVLLVAHGEVKAGMDLSRLGPEDVRIKEKSISLTLPPVQITDAFLDEKQTQVIERTTGLLRTFDKDLESSARQQALDDIKRAARRAGILQQAEERARLQLANLFHQLGFERVEFRCEVNGEKGEAGNNK